MFTVVRNQHTSALQLLQLPSHLGLEFRLARQVQLIATREYLFFLGRPKRILDHRVVFVRAQDQPQSRVVTLSPPLLIKIVYVELELPEILMGQFADLEINQHVAFENCQDSPRSAW